MALLDWDAVKWAAFVAGVRGYRDDFAPKGREDLAYLRGLSLVQEVPLARRAERSPEILRLLNTWACRLSSSLTPPLLAGWIGANTRALAKLEPLTIVHPELPARAAAIGALHDELIASLRAGGVRNMSDAAASKALHLLLPGLFVMWDREIRRSAPEGYGAYMGADARARPAPAGRSARARRRGRGSPPAGARRFGSQDARQAPRRVQLVRGGRPRAARRAQVAACRTGGTG